jgi:hypothetical protein
LSLFKHHTPGRGGPERGKSLPKDTELISASGLLPHCMIFFLSHHKSQQSCLCELPTLSSLWQRMEHMELHTAGATHRYVPSLPC